MRISNELLVLFVTIFFGAIILIAMDLKRVGSANLDYGERCLTMTFSKEFNLWQYPPVWTIEDPKSGSSAHLDLPQNRNDKGSPKPTHTAQA